MALAFANWLAICITAWSLFSLALYAAAIGWCLVHVDWRACVNWLWVRDLMSRAWTWCRASFPTWQGSGKSHIDTAVYNLVQQRTRGFIRRALLVIAPICALGDLFLIGRAVGLLHVENAEHPKNSHLIVSAAARVVTALCAFREEQPTKQIMAAFQIVSFGSMVLKLHSCSVGIELLFDRSALAIRVMFALSLCDLRLTVFCNAIYSSLMTYKFHEFASNDEQFAQLGLANHVYQELVIFVGLVAFHVVLSWRLETEARSTIDAKVSTKFIAGLRKLLKTNYDVVVELDDQMMLTDDAKDLAGVLLHGTHRSLKGSLITDLMANDADKDVFSAYVSEPSSGSESQGCAIPHIFHMRDSCSNVLCMEMWHTRFEDLESRLRHLIGIKEVYNDEHTGSTTGPTGMPMAAFQRTPPGSARGRRSSSGVDVSDEEQPRQGHISRHAPQQHAALENVPPRDHSSRTLDGADSDISSVSSIPSGVSHKRMVEGFRLTSAQAQRASMLHTLAAWNVALRPAGCCAYHDLMKEATRTTKWLEKNGCQQVDSIHSQSELWQCPTCGILSMSAADANYDHLARVCYLCRDYHVATLKLVEL